MIGAVNSLNGNVEEESIVIEKVRKRTLNDSDTSNFNEMPRTSKKKKLALDDLDDSTVVKNFITNDEIDEFDEDDSEDETFEPSEEQ